MWQFFQEQGQWEALEPQSLQHLYISVMYRDTDALPFMLKRK